MTQQKPDRDRDNAIPKKSGAIDSREGSSAPSRRDFIKRTTAAGAGFMILPRHVLGGRGYTPPSDKLVIAGIGVGGKGRSDLNSFHERDRKSTRLNSSHVAISYAVF